MAETTSLRITLYLHSLYNGGIERVLFELGARMLARGLQADLVVDKYHYSPMRDEVPAGVRFVDLESDSGYKRLPNLVRYLRANRPAGIISAGHLANELAILAAGIARGGIRVVTTDHTALSVELQASDSSKARQMIIPRLSHFLYPRAAANVAVSDGVGEDCRRFFGLRPNRVRTIYNPIDGVKIRALGRQAAQHPWFADGAPKVFVAIGRLEKQKDFPTLLTAFQTVRARHDVRLAIFGMGSLKDELEGMIRTMGMADSVQLPGFTPNPFPYIARSAALVLSSAWEGLPTTILEALALGAHVVSTDCPSGPREILEGGKHGILVPVGDAAALATGMETVLAGKAPKVSSDALNRFRGDHVLDQYLDALGIQGHRLRRASGATQDKESGA